MTTKLQSKLFCLLFALFPLLSKAQNKGLCLHGFSPTAPPEKVQAFEYLKAERTQDGYRFFLKPTGSTIVTNYRLRAMINYPAKLSPTDPELPKLLAIYEEQAAKYPAAKPYLTPWIDRMRSLLSEVEKQRNHVESLSKITLEKNTYLGATFNGFDKGSLILKHHDGFTRIPVAELPADFVPKLIKVDPKAKEIKTATISGKLLYNPKFDAIAEGSLRFTHEGGKLVLPLTKVAAGDLKEINNLVPPSKKLVPSTFDGTHYFNFRFSDFTKNGLSFQHAGGELVLRYEELKPGQILEANRLLPNGEKLEAVTIAGRQIFNPSFQRMQNGSVELKHRGGLMSIALARLSRLDLDIINEWSDGSWKIAEPGISGYSQVLGDYQELVTADAKKYTKVRISTIEGDSVLLDSAEGSLTMGFDQLINLKGLAEKDVTRLNALVEDILVERAKAADVTESRKVVKFTPVIGAATDRFEGVVAVIGQVIREPAGVLVDGFVGRRKSGTNTVEVTRAKSYDHPVTGERIREVISTQTEFEEVHIEDGENVQCFVACDPGDAADGEVIRLGTLERAGTFNYTNILGASRTVRRYE